MVISVLVNGAFGRMGQITAKALQEDDQFELVGQTSREYDLKKAILDSKAQVVIDFTNPDSVLDNSKTIIETGAHPVIGTSGLKMEEIQLLQKLCAAKKLGGIIAPNFSLGAVLLMKCAREIARYMSEVEIIELHHNGKKDSPSGTALRTAEMIAETRKKISNEIKNVETVPGARGAHYCDMQIHSVRLPGLLAHEQVVFGNLGESLSLRHDTIDRQCFMPGILFACEKVVKLDHLVYGLEHIL